MILPLVAFLLQTAETPAVSPPADKPVRVWLVSSSPLLRGDPVRVYVRTAVDGNLVVLHRRTDGRIEVLFPGNPTDDPYVRAGTYEIQGAGAGGTAAGSRAAFVVAEPDGTGLILAALSAGSYRFDEFVRAASWDPDALVPSWSGADAEGALADVVQRMLGDGFFNYDVVTYSVAPRPTLYGMGLQDSAPAPQYPSYPSCVDCSFVGFQEIIYEPFSLCDPFFADCLGVPFRRHERFSGSGSPGSNPPMNVMALSIGPARFGSVSRVVPQGPRFVSKPRAASPPPPIAPRARVPAAPSRDGAAVAVHAIPLGPGHVAVGGRPARVAVVARSRAVAARAAPASFWEARLTLSPIAPAEAPRPAPAAHSGAELVAVPRDAVAPAAEHRVAAALPRSRIAGAMPSVQSLAQPLPQSRAMAGVGATSQLRGMALAGSAWHALGSHAAAVAVAGRRR